MAAFEVLALDTATPQIRAPGASDTYTFPRAVELPLGTANGVLYLDGSKVVTSGSALTFDGTNFSTTGTATATKLIPTGGAATGNGMYLPATNTLAWSTNGAEGLRLDASRNLGLGTTPTTGWRSGARAFQSGANKYVSLWEQSNGSANLGFAVYESGTNTFAYTTTGDSPTLYSQLTGAHKWYTAPSGTAGNAISFTQAMAIPAAGGLVVGAAALATSATDGFLYVPTCAGTPTGTPTTQTGTAPIVVDTTNNKLYFYSGGSWVAAN